MSSPMKKTIREKLSRPCPERVWYLRYALKSGMTVEQIYELTGIDPVVPRQPVGDRRDRRSASAREKI